MLQKLNDEIRECHALAAQNAEEAKTESDDRMRQRLVHLEQAWLRLARGFEFLQSMEAFLLDADKRRNEDASRT